MDKNTADTAVALFELQVEAFLEGVSECVPDAEAFGLSDEEAREARDGLVREACAA